MYLGRPAPRRRSCAGTLAWVGLAVVVAARGASAQTPDDASVWIPAGYERFDLADLTFTMRDDTFSTIATDSADSATAYVGTHQGRIYKTINSGRTWTESTVIPEQGLLWATPGSSIFFGSIRSSGGGLHLTDLIGERRSPIDFAHVPSGLSRLPSPAAPTNALATETALSHGGGEFALGVGLSERSPRLSLLTASRGRPVPTLNRVKFLVDRSLRGTTIFNIAIDPDDRRLLFAATQNGLYTSFDGGDSWARSFAGLTAAERTSLRIAIRPGSPKLMILGTTSGAYTSVNQGDSWSKLTTVGGVIEDVAFDKDPNVLYLATNGGLLRSSDGGRSFIPIYYTTAANGHVRWITIDPFDAETGYIGTMDGAYVTHDLKTGRQPAWGLLAGTLGSAIPRVAACAKHRGHIYAQMRIELHTISYGASPPETAIVESWDGGQRFRRIFTGQSAGLAETFALDAKDPDQLWIGWTRALHRLQRAATKTTATTAPWVRDVVVDGPAVGEIVLAALTHHGLELDDYTDKIQRSTFSRIVPRVVTATGTYRQWSAGGILDDAQLAASRYLQIADSKEWQVMVWASWSLPDAVYSKNSVPMLRQRVQILNDELRRRLTETVYRSYGELQRINALLPVAELDLQTHVTYRLRIEQLEAVVDLTSGGYLTRWKKEHRRNAE